MRINFAAVTTAVLLLTAACTPQKGTITSDGSSTVTGSIFATKVYPTSEGENWTAIKSGSTFYIKGTAVTIKGTCTRGVAVIKVGESGPAGAYYSEEATCLDDGSFTWSKTYTGPIDTDKTLSLVAKDVEDNTISGAVDTVDVHVDNVVPPDPVITFVNSDPYTDPLIYSNASTTVTVHGTVSGDAVRVAGAYSASLTPTGVNWNQDVTLTPGQAHSFGYTAYDLAGNASSTIYANINYTPSIDVLAGKFDTYSGGRTTDTSGSATGWVFEISSAFTTTGTVTSTTSTQQLDTGFNYVTNSARQ